MNDLHSAWIADLLSLEINLLPVSQEHVQPCTYSAQINEFPFSMSHNIRYVYKVNVHPPSHPKLMIPKLLLV